MRTRKRRGGAFDIMSPVQGIDFILLDIEEIKIKYRHELLDRNMKTIEELRSKVDFEKYHIERISPDILDHKLQLYVIDLETRKIVCIVSFKIKENDIGYIDFISCNIKIEKYKPSSYLAFYQVLKIFEHFNVRHCYLTVVPDYKIYWKLYKFYSDIGFHCMSVDKSGRGNIEDVKELSPNNRNTYIRTRRNTFMENKQKVKNENRSQKNFEDYFYNCNDMVGNVSELLIKLKTTLKIE
jgi:hypothetical protein